MFRITPIDFKDAGALNQLVADYLDRNKNLSSFYDFFPDKQGFAKLFQTSPYREFDREPLHDILMRQSSSVKNTHQATTGNISLLKNKNCFTVTTGHQLCLFTGPLYFVYKIFSTINLAEALKKEFPEFDFVPVYWLASEDHDFEEVCSFNSNGSTVKWESDQKGAVGEFKTNELAKILPALRSAFGISDNANYLFSLFERAYLGNQNLALATRYLVNELFGRYGLITLEANDAEFKKQASHIFKVDIFGDTIAKRVQGTAAKLEQLGYQVQVHPREINLFYLDHQVRSRIVKKDEGFALADEGKTFTVQEMNELIASPQKLSPNVVLRPVYQQVILPNLAYVGGPGELAYWLEFKDMFAGLSVHFPVLMPRNFLSVVDKAAAQKTDQLGLETGDLFKDEDEMIKNFMQRNNRVFDLSEEKKKVSDIFEGIIERSGAIDKTLVQHVSAELQRTLNKLNGVSAKSNRALKRRSETDIGRIAALKQKLFPKGVPQERYENFSSLYIQYGPAFFDMLKNEIDPFELFHKVITEE